MTAVKGTCSLLLHSQAFFPCRFRYPTAIKLLSTRLSSQYRSVNVKAVCEQRGLCSILHVLTATLPSVAWSLRQAFLRRRCWGFCMGFRRYWCHVLTEADWHRNGNSGVMRPCASSREGISIPQRFVVTPNRMRESTVSQHVVVVPDEFGWQL